MNLNLKQPRKIVSWRYSFLITLPLAWLRHNNLGKGDSVDFEIADDGSLIVRPYKED